MPWLLVQFEGTEEVEVLPVSWYNGDDSTIFYPPLPRAQLEKAIKNEIEPDRTWTKYAVKLLRPHAFDNFKTANNKAAKACVTSEISDVEEVFPNKRIPKKKILSSDDDSDESLFSVPIPPVKKPKALTMTEDKQKEVAGVSRQTEKEGNGNVENTKPFTNSNMKDHSDDAKHSGDSKFKEIISVLIKQKRILNDHDEKLDSILNSLDETKIALSRLLEKVRDVENLPIDSPIDIFENLPITCSEDFERIETLLENKDARDKFIQDMCRLGGSSYKECSRRFMKKIVVDDFAKLYSLHGHKGKRVFAKTKIFLAVVDAILKSDKNTNARNIEVVIGQWLAKATERLQKKGLNEPELQNVGDKNGAENGI